jgi:hypothetical protein
MKPHHAAALALVGWFLAMPSSIIVTRTGNSWGPNKRSTFDSYEQCSNYRQNLIATLQLGNFPLNGFVVSKSTQFEDRLAN